MKLKHPYDNYLFYHLCLGHSRLQVAIEVSIMQEILETTQLLTYYSLLELGSGALSRYKEQWNYLVKDRDLASYSKYLLSDRFKAKGVLQLDLSKDLTGLDLPKVDVLLSPYYLSATLSDPNGNLVNPSRILNNYSLLLKQNGYLIEHCSSLKIKTDDYTVNSSLPRENLEELLAIIPKLDKVSGKIRYKVKYCVLNHKNYAVVTVKHLSFFRGPLRERIDFSSGSIKFRLKALSCWKHSRLKLVKMFKVIPQILDNNGPLVEETFSPKSADYALWRLAE